MGRIFSALLVVAVWTAGTIWIVSEFSKEEAPPPGVGMKSPGHREPGRAAGDVEWQFASLRESIESIRGRVERLESQLASGEPSLSMGPGAILPGEGERIRSVVAEILKERDDQQFAEEYARCLKEATADVEDLQEILRLLETSTGATPEHLEAARTELEAMETDLERLRAVKDMSGLEAWKRRRE